jgi:hypothetical protein
VHFHDARKDPSVPVPAGLERLRAALVAQAKDNLIPYKLINCLHITLADHDPHTELSVPHLQLNYEPKWITEEFKEHWQRLYGKRLRSSCLENTEFRRFAWGVWESDQT